MFNHTILRIASVNFVVLFLFSSTDSSGPSVSCLHLYAQVRVRLKSAYFAKIKKNLVESTVNKGKS